MVIGTAVVTGGNTTIRRCITERLNDHGNRTVEVAQGTQREGVYEEYGSSRFALSEGSWTDTASVQGHGVVAFPPGRRQSRLLARDVLGGSVMRTSRRTRLACA